MKDALLYFSFVNLSSISLSTLYIYLCALTGHFEDCKKGHWNQHIN